MYDSLEMPPPTVVKIPRIRNGDIISVRCEDVDCERARLLGIMALAIAAVTNSVMSYSMQDRIGNGLREELGMLPSNETSIVVPEDMLDRLKHIMQVLLDNDLDTFVAILDALKASNSSEEMAESLFKSFINYDLVV